MPRPRDACARRACASSRVIRIGLLRFGREPFGRSRLRALRMPTSTLLVLSLLAADPTPATSPASATPADTGSAQPKYRGTGLLATAGVLGATSLSMMIGRNVMLHKGCPLKDGAAVAQCTYNLRSDIAMGSVQWAANLTNLGIAPGAGVMLARYHAWHDGTTGRQRPLRAIMGAGGGVLGVGLAGVATSVALSFVLPVKCLDKELASGDPLAGDRCLLKGYAGWTTLHFASFSMVSAGAAMLAYGGAYRRASKGGAQAEVNVAPFAGRGQAGLAISGRF